MFDLDWYRARAGIDADIDPIKHYLIEGWRVGLEPCGGFEGALLFPYYQSAGYSGPPAVTYLKLRAAGGRAYPTLGAVEHWAPSIRESDLFDADDMQLALV